MDEKNIMVNDHVLQPGFRNAKDIMVTNVKTVQEIAAF
jgi:hypothetical protein